MKINLESEGRPTENPSVILARMRQNREKSEEMDVSQFLSDVYLLGQTEVRNLPKTAGLLTTLGRDKKIWSATLELLKTADEAGQSTKVAEGLDIARLLGMDEMLKVADIMLKLEKKYSITTISTKEATEEAEKILSNLRDAWTEKEGESYEESRAKEEGSVFLRDKVTEGQIETEGGLKPKFFNIWQDPGRKPVELTILMDRNKGEKLLGEDFVGFVLPSNEDENSVCEDQAGFVELKDGTKIFMGADGVGGSYFGKLAAQEAINMMVDYLQRTGKTGLDELIANPEGSVIGMGENMQDFQRQFIDHFEQNIANNPEYGSLFKEALEEKARHGSQTTFFLVAIFPSGGVHYLSIGDGVMEKITTDGQIEDLLSIDKSYRPDGRFTTVGGFLGQYREGKVQLNKGDTFLFGTDGMKHCLELLQALSQRADEWASLVPQVADDLTVFAYNQRSGKPEPKIGLSSSPSPFMPLKRPQEVQPKPTPSKETVILGQEAMGKSPEEMINQINQQLARSQSNEVSLQTTPQAVLDYLKTVSLPAGAKIKGLTEGRINGNEFIINGAVGTLLGNAEFNVTFNQTPDGKLVVINKPRVKTSMRLGIALKAKGINLEDMITHLDQIATDQISQRVDPKWGLTGFGIAGGNLAFNFRRKFS